MSSSLLSAFKREGPDARASEAPSGLSVETMFQQIMTSLAKSSEEIAELRQECSDLRVANNSLERQLRDSVMNGRYGTPQGFMTPTAPASPLLRPKTPFLSANAIPTLMTPPAVFAPSALGDNRASKTYQADQIREIEGFYVVIPAGGAGTRLWPLSREGHPKFLLDLTLKGRSLIQATWDRLLPLTGQLRTAVVAGPAHVKGINEQLPDLLPQMLFTEPGPKDSMAAIGLAAAVLGKRDPDAVIGSFAADHMISGDEAFLSAVTEAVQVARQGYITTIGIAPSHPSTGFGYIRLGDRLAIDGAPNARVVSSFKEKPDARTAAAYIATGSYRWNAGMFVVKATVLLEELEKYKPELAEGLRKIADAWDGDEGKRQRVLEEVWPTLEKIPIDNAVAEPAAQEGKVAVVPATFGWDDVGDFSSLADLLPADASQPRILGDSGLVLTEQVAGGIVVPGSGRLVAALGVDDLVIVDMPDTLMVTTRARSQEVKKLVAKAKALGWKTLL